LKSIRAAKSIGARIAMSYIVVLICTMVVFMAGTAIVLYLQMQTQLGHYAVQDIETVEGLVSFTPDGVLKVNEDYHNHPESKLVLDRYLEIVAPDGRVLYRNERLGNLALAGAPGPDEGVGGYSEHSTTLQDGTRVRMVSRRHILDSRTVLLRLAYSEDPIETAVVQLLTAAALIFPVMIAIAAFAGFRMSRRTLAPVQQITAQAERITSSNLHERIPGNNTGDEFDHLAEVFNRTMARLEQSFQQLRQFTADASHELRTPLAAIRSVGEVGLEKDGTREEYRELVGSMLEEVNRLTRLVDDLLVIARADSGVIQLKYSIVDLAALTRDTVILLEPLADEKDQTLAFFSAGVVPIRADPAILRQAIINVLHNAIKYSPSSSAISIEVGQEAELTIEDAGPGIPPEHASRIFDRFYRIDHGRSRDAGGFGLGLSIAKWAVNANGGTIDVSGNTFRIRLPRESQDAGSVAGQTGV
jgi:heavy metal sensor kinase